MGRKKNSGSKEEVGKDNEHEKAMMRENLKVKEAALRNLKIKDANTTRLTEKAVALDVVPKSLRDWVTLADWVTLWKLK